MNKKKKIVSNLSKLVGKTPLVDLSYLSQRAGTRITGKLEFLNPTGSVKDRIAVNILRDAEKRGHIKAGTTVIEPTSGNTGTSLAAFAAAKPFKLILTMPDTADTERRKILQALGAELVITPAEEGMRGAIEKAEELMASIPDSFMPQQFLNPANPESHEKTTGREIWKDSCGEVTHIIAGVGTGGTITGIARYIHKKNDQVRIIAVEPKDSAVLSGSDAGRHRIHGIGPGFIPRTLDRNIIHNIVTVHEHEAKDACKELATNTGILAGYSSGAAVAAAEKYSKEHCGKDDLVVVILPDNGIKYLSTGLYE